MNVVPTIIPTEASQWTAPPSSSAWLDVNEQSRMWKSIEFNNSTEPPLEPGEPRELLEKTQLQMRGAAPSQKTAAPSAAVPRIVP